MTGKEYLEEKAKIVEFHTKMVFMPKEQIQDVEITRDMVLNMQLWLDDIRIYLDDGDEPYLVPMKLERFRSRLLNGWNCLYCTAYDNEYGDCSGCPVAEAGNHCVNDKDNTYYNNRIAVLNNSIDDIVGLQKRLVDLAERFVEAHKHLLGDTV